MFIHTYIQRYVYIEKEKTEREKEREGERESETQREIYGDRQTTGAPYGLLQCRTSGLLAAPAVGPLGQAADGVL